MPGRLDVRILDRLTPQELVAMQTPVWWEFCGNESSWKVIGPFDTKEEAAIDAENASPPQSHCLNDHGIWYCSTLTMLDKGMKRAIGAPNITRYSWTINEILDKLYPYHETVSVSEEEKERNERRGTTNQNPDAATSNLASQLG